MHAFLSTKIRNMHLTCTHSCANVYAFDKFDDDEFSSFHLVTLLLPSFSKLRFLYDFFQNTVITCYIHDPYNLSNFEKKSKIFQKEKLKKNTQEKEVFLCLP